MMKKAGPLTAGSCAETGSGRSGRGSPTLCSVCTRRHGDRTPGCTGNHGIQGTGSTPSCGGRKGDG